MGITGYNQQTLCVYFTWYILERGGVILQATLQVMEATCVDKQYCLVINAEDFAYMHHY